MSNYSGYCFRNQDQAEPTLEPDGSGPATESQPSSQSEADRNAVAAELLRLMKLYADVVNAQDYTCSTPSGLTMKSHVSPLFKAKFDSVPSTLNWDGLLEIWSSWKREDADIRLSIRHGSCDVDLEKGEAVLYAEMDSKGSSVSTCGLVEVQWKRMKADGKWVMVHYWAMRGIWQQGGLA